MPVLLAGRNPDDVARPNVLDRPTPSLGAAHSGCHDQGLAKRVRVPGRPGAGLERDARSGASNSRSLRTVPVNHSAGPLADGCEPLRLISISPPRVAAAVRTNGNVRV